MLFNTLQFAVFFLIVYCLYLVLGHRWRNRLLLVGSYIFYGAWDWRFLFLIIASTLLDYICGIKIHTSNETKKRKLFLFLSVSINMSLLGFFKYFGFFAVSLQRLLGVFGVAVQPHFLNIILPIGISFYTFQTMSYTIDIYRRELAPTRKLLDFAVFVAFFPQLVAGPIERAKHLLPQVLSPRKVTLSKFYEGAYLVFWGLFMKVFIADNLAKIVDPVFAIGSSNYSGPVVLVALYAFAFQIFCDFAGYSSIARGVGRMMGFDIMVNFNLPYFATNPREFWQRWHISLSTWLKDYLYISLGGNRKSKFNTCRNLTLTMVLGGLWHGAAWKFVAWGVYQGMLLIGHRLAKPLLDRFPSPRSIVAKKIWPILKILIFFHFVCIGWLLFRAESLSQAFFMLKSIFFNFVSGDDAGLKLMVLKTVFFTWLLILVQIYQYRKNDLMIMFKVHPAIRAVFYVICYYLIIIYGVSGGEEFIYFQF